MRGQPTSATQRKKDGLEHLIRLAQDLIVPKPQNSETTGFQVGRSPRIRCALFNVLAAIHFHDQTSIQADEIDEIGPDRMLPAEFPTCQAASA